MVGLLVTGSRLMSGWRRKNLSFEFPLDRCTTGLFT